MRVRPRTVAAAAVVAVGAAGIGLGAAHLHHPAHRAPARSFGTVPAAAVPALTPPASAAAPAAPAAVHASPTGIPVRVTVPRLRVDAPVVPVASDGPSIEVPDRPSTLGWWLGGAQPGSLVGDTVVVGHVDSASAGPGALFHLDAVRAGDSVLVAVAGGVVRYRVTALRVVHKSTGLASLHLDGGGPAQLVLITCGGPFDARTRSYADNIVVDARPVA